MLWVPIKRYIIDCLEATIVYLSYYNKLNNFNFDFESDAKLWYSESI